MKLGIYLVNIFNMRDSFFANSETKDFVRRMIISWWRTPLIAFISLTEEWESPCALKGLILITSELSYWSINHSSFLYINMYAYNMMLSRWLILLTIFLMEASLTFGPNTHKSASAALLALSVLSEESLNPFKHHIKKAMLSQSHDFQIRIT